MTRATGVESSHLRVVPRTEEISRRWMVLDALNPPNMYADVAIELKNIANMRSAAYPRMYLTGKFRVSGKKNVEQDSPDRIDLPRGKDFVLGGPVTQEPSLLWGISILKHRDDDYKSLQLQEQLLPQTNTQERQSRTARASIRPFQRCTFGLERND